MHVALIDRTDKTITFAEEISDRAAAERRRYQLALQAEMNAGGLNPDADPSHDWQAYLGEEPFSWPAEPEPPAEPEA